MDLLRIVGAAALPFVVAAALPFLGVAALALLVACSQGDAPLGPQQATLTGDAGARFAGELVVRGDPAVLDPGVVTISIVRPGDEAPILTRSWDLGDPVWRASHGEQRLYFSLDARDAWPDVQAEIGPDMELLARWDPDGNPVTDEPEVARVRMPARAGATDLSVELPIRAQVVVHPPSGSTGGG
jgi:hypothetical protein